MKSTIKYDIPLYENTPQGEDCVPAVFQMVVNYFQPERKLSRGGANKLVGHIGGKGTWFFPAMAKLKKEGYKIVVKDTFDYQRCFKEREKYLKEYYKDDRAYKWCVKHTDLLNKINDLPEFIKEVKPIFGLPTLEEVENYLSQGYLVACEVNAAMLDNKNAFYDHLVLVVGYDKDNLIINDPGPNPSYKDRIVDKELFDKAWAFAGEDTKSIVAFKYG